METAFSGLKEQHISSEVIKIVKAFQNVQLVGGYVYQLPTLENMVEQENRR
jgi:hypothetical protein